MKSKHKVPEMLGNDSYHITSAKQGIEFLINWNTDMHDKINEIKDYLEKKEKE